MPTVDELAAKYGGGPQKSVGPVGVDIDALAEKYGSGPDLTTLPKNIQKFPELESVPTRQPTSVESFQGGVGQGLRDIPQGAAAGIGAADEAVFPGGADRNRLFKQKLNKQQGQYETKYGDNETAAIGRTVGQVIGTAPLVPNAAIARVAGALPVAGATGGKIAAPFINRLLAATGKGAVGGGEFGALTNQTNTEGLASNVGKGLITGAIGGPIVEGASGLAGKAVQGAEGLWANVSASKIAASTGLPLSAVKNVIGRLEAAGLTPTEAQLALNKLGPKATLADLDRSLTTELSGLTSEGEKAGAIAKGRMDARAETANSDAVKLFESKFGPKPVLEAEKEAIHKQARALTKADYDAAHKSPQALDLSTSVADIDKALENAVGAKASNLKEVKGYLFKEVKDPVTSNITKVLKSDVASLHEARQGIDDIINKKGDKLPPNALAAVQKVRDAVDTALKTNPQMAAADLKFAKHMDVKSGLDFGYNVIGKGNINKEEFKTAFDSFEPAVKEGVKKGMRAAVGDIMEKSSQGELTGAARIFDKKALNRANFKHAFGPDADTVLDELHRDIAFRNTERAVTQGSQTAERQAVQARYGQTRSRPSALAEGGRQLIVDYALGTPGAAATFGAAKTAVGNKLISRSENRLGQLVEGSADILSRSGPERDIAVGILERVKKIQDKTASSTKGSVLRLPVAASAPIGEQTYEKGKNAAANIKALIFGR